MITLAIDTATARATVALGEGDRSVEAHLDGARRHTRETLGMIDRLLRDWGATPADITRVLSGDGPGSFTGLRVSAAIAKALLWQRPEVEWWVAPSLLIQAWPRLAVAGEPVIAVADALRGELYAGCWWRDGEGLHGPGVSAAATAPRALATARRPAAVVGVFPEALTDAIVAATGQRPEPSWPDARSLLALEHVPGGLTRVSDPDGWQPTYGRPAEAQVVWEQKHGRALPDSTYRAG